MSRESEKKIASFFDAESQSMKKRHEDEGVPESMQWQVEALVEAKTELVLDVGSGPGTLLMELLKAGVPRAVGVDLSQDMVDVAEERLAQMDLSDRASFHTGSFLDLDLEDQPDGISFHRVLCCHPDRQGMLDKAVFYQPRLISLSVPRDWKILRALLGVAGIFARLFGSFRPYIHSQKSIDQQLEELGYSVIDRHKSFWWITTTYQTKKEL